jgi:hypothetical protein
MSVTTLQFADQDRYLGQIEKIAHSQTLRKAESLCKLLRYLGHHALVQPGVPLKEYQIATEVFGRPENFDPQADSAIRVQAGRLRLKLVDYYSHEGLNDPIVVEMPAGSYILNFLPREASSLAVTAAVTASATAAVPAQFPTLLPPVAPRRRRRGWMIAAAALSLLLVAALVMIGTLYEKLGAARAVRRSELKASPALRRFWNQFDSSPYAPWVVFSNAAFVGRPETGMRYMNPAHDSRDLVLDHYTGVGEVLAVHELDKVFSLLNHPIEVKRGSLFTLDDAKKNDLIFVGSPAENLALSDLPGSQEFIFKRLDLGPHAGDLGIVNMHPEPGEASVFFPSGSSQPLSEDYAIVALVHGLDPARHVLILAGTTTLGTQAAVEYVCSNNSAEELLRRLAFPSGEEVKPFEALLRVKVTRGVPVGTELVAVRHRQ